tara:strand:+ start:360 stop:650 length:291 start_codon:yes stop_codon:yes gene_type:complete
MSLRTQARVLAIASSYLSILINGNGKGPTDLRYIHEQPVNSSANAENKQDEAEKGRDLNSIPEMVTGGAGGIRTPDLLRAREALSQLSYSPKLTTY